MKIFNLETNKEVSEALLYVTQEEALKLRLLLQSLVDNPSRGQVQFATSDSPQCEITVYLEES